MTDTSPDAPGKVCLLYDRACPICRAGAAVEMAGAEPGTLETQDARADSALRQQATARGIDLDRSFVVAHGGRFYVGAEAAHFLSRRPHRTWLSTILSLPFRNLTIARLLYPPLMGLRRALVRLNGVGMINNLPPSKRDDRH